jgi:hypothetical protein
MPQKVMSEQVANKVIRRQNAPIVDPVVIRMDLMTPLMGMRSEKATQHPDTS